MTTSWGAKAVQSRLRIRWGVAKQAIANLIKRGALEAPPRGRRQRPLYRLPAGNEIFDCSAVRRAWLPRSLVDNAVVDNIRRTRNKDALVLLVRLYAEQALLDFGGVPTSLLHLPFDRRKVGERGQVTVWGFTPMADGVHTNPGLTDWFENADHCRVALATLAKIDLFEVVPQVMWSGDADARPLHSLSFRGAGEAFEQQVTATANMAARSLLSPAQLATIREDRVLLPSAHEIELVGVVRLRHRPQTSMTKAWREQATRDADAAVTCYRTIARTHVSGMAVRHRAA